MQDYTWSQCSPIDNSGKKRSIFRSSYKNIRFTLEPGNRIILTQKDIGNLPGISYREYGTVDLWRIILEYNGLRDPIQDLQPGIELVLPTKSSVVNHLSQTTDNTLITI